MGKYQIINRKNSSGLKEFLVKEGQVLLPFVESIERAEKALDEVIDEAGRATIEAVLELSARNVAGEKHPGRESSEVRWHGHQDGVSEPVGACGVRRVGEVTCEKTELERLRQTIPFRRVHDAVPGSRDLARTRRIVRRKSSAANLDEAVLSQLFA